MNRIIKRMAIPVGAAIVLGSSGFAFMATNTVLETHAGRGEGQISGYVVSGVTYSLDLADSYPDGFGNPALDKIRTVSFNLDHKASTVSAQIRNGSGDKWIPYSSCGSDDGGYHWSCKASGTFEASLSYNPSSPSTLTSDRLSVSAAQ